MGGKCINGAIMFVNHSENATDVLMDWLQSMRIVANAETDNSYYEYPRTELTTEPRADESHSKPICRDSLHLEDTTEMMDNSDLLEFFSGDIRRMISKFIVYLTMMLPSYLLLSNDIWALSCKSGSLNTNS